MMMCHKIGGGWVITLPDSFKAEYVESDKMYQLTDEQNGVTVRLAPMSARKENGELIPKEGLGKAYAHSLDSLGGRASVKEAEHDIGNGLLSMSFEYTQFVKGELNFFISCGIYCDGAILSTSISGTVREDCEKVLEYIKEVVRE